MRGKNALWVPGTDHASIATEARVVAQLKEEGKVKSDLTREEFLEKAWAWKEKHDGIILEQLKKLGCSCDWERTRFTMEPKLSEAVIKVFVDLHKKGLIYRGIRMVNWDPKGQTAVSDEEVIHKEIDASLYHIKYKIEGTFYVPIKNQQNQVIDNDKIKKLSDDFEIGGHSVNHKVLTELSDDELDYEISESKKLLEEITGKRIISFCYPLGKYNKKTIAKVKHPALVTAGPSRARERY